MADKLISLSYSTWSMYKQCPKRYKEFTVGFKDLPPPTERDVYNYTFGNVMHKIAEHFYKEKMYLDCRSIEEVKKVYFRLRDKAAEIFDRHTSGLTLGVKFKPLTREEFLQRIERSTKRFLSFVVRDRLFDRYTGSELDLRLRLDRDKIALFGKIDLAIIRKSENKTIIIDFKSQPNDTIEIAQLDWYSLLWYLKWGYYPHELRFAYFEGGQEYDSVEPDVNRCDVLYADILKIRDRIMADKEFKAVRNDNCWSCPLRMNCEQSPYSERKRDLERLRADERDVIAFTENPTEAVEFMKGIFDE